MKTFIQLLISFSLIFSLSFVFPVDVDYLGTGEGIEVAYAKSKQSIFEGQNINASVDDQAEAKKFVDKIRSASNIFAGIILALSTISILIGALRYVFSGGNQQNAEMGKMIIMYSGIGIVIALSTFAIARLFASFGF